MWQRRPERLTCASRRRGGNGPVHRFVRGAGDAETVNVMVAGRLQSKLHPKVLRRKVFAVLGGTSAQLAPGRVPALAQTRDAAAGPFAPNRRGAGDDGWRQLVTVLKVVAAA